MFKKVLVAIAATAMVASAVPVNLKQITGYAGTEVYKDSGHQVLMLTDTDGNSDDATAFLFIEVGDYAPNNAFGIYSYSVDAFGAVSVIDQLEVFSGAAAPVTSTTVAFNLATGVATNQATMATANIGKMFGVYLSNNVNGPFTWYSHSSLNADNGTDHFMLFNTSNNAVGSLLGSDVIIAIEDLPNGGDWDYNDMVIGMSDVIPVPEPTMIGLLGLGLIGLVAYRRKK